jgi:hypothetical protein
MVESRSYRDFWTTGVIISQLALPARKPSAVVGGVSIPSKSVKQPPSRHVTFVPPSSSGLQRLFNDSPKRRGAHGELAENQNGNNSLSSQDHASLHIVRRNVWRTPCGATNGMSGLWSETAKSHQIIGVFANRSDQNNQLPGISRPCGERQPSPPGQQRRFLGSYHHNAARTSQSPQTRLHRQSGASHRFSNL